MFTSVPALVLIVKIDNLVHVAHNVIIGENSAVIANAMIAGSTKIGVNSTVSPSVSLTNGINIGENSTIGMGSVVIRNIPSNEVWAGVPARELSKYK